MNNNNFRHSNNSSPTNSKSDNLSATIDYQSNVIMKDLDGIVFNLHDPVNYDIDLTLTDDLKKRYKDVIQKSYTFYYDNDEKKTVQEGTIYKCRLTGIKFQSEKSTKEDQEISFQSECELKKLFQQTDWKVKCDIGDVDIYRRILVSIKIIKNVEVSTNIKNFLLEKYPNHFKLYPEVNKKKFQKVLT